MRSRLSSTTAMIAALAIAAPVSPPAFAQTNAAPEAGFSCPEGTSAADCAALVTAAEAAEAAAVAQAAILAAADAAAAAQAAVEEAARVLAEEDAAAAQAAEAAAAEAAAQAEEAAAAAEAAVEEAARVQAEDDAAAAQAAEAAAAAQAAEEEAARVLAAEEEAERVLAEDDAAAAQAAEAAVAAQAAEEEAARVLAAEEEAARVLAAEEEAARVLAAEEEAARVLAAEDNAAAAQAAEAAAAEAAIQAEEAARVLSEDDADAAQAAEAAAAALAAEEEAARVLAEDDAAAAQAETAAADEVITDEQALQDALAAEQDGAETPVLATEAPADPAVGAAVETLAGDDTDGVAAEEEVVETVTEENSRQSSEDFGETDTAAPAAATGTPAPERTRRTNLSPLEQALIGGGAGLLVGTLLSGNREVVSRSDDRVIVLTPQGDYQVLRDDNALLRRPGTEIRTQSYADGSTRTVALNRDGSQVITIRDAELRVIRRVAVAPDGRQTVIIDDTQVFAPVDFTALPRPVSPSVRPIETTNADDLRLALMAQQSLDRRFSLAQVRQIPEVRYLAPAVNIDGITFETGSAAIRPDQARQLNALGQLLADLVCDNPNELFLIEGHTDAVGGAASNLALSDRRAESVALALAEYFDVPPANLVVQGYGEGDLLVPSGSAERANRRAVVRRITPLLQAGL